MRHRNIGGGFWLYYNLLTTIQWRHNERDGFSDHQPHHCLLNCLFRRRWKKTSKLRVTGLCAGNSLVTGEFPAQRASNVENVSIWRLHHADTSFAISPCICAKWHTWWHHLGVIFVSYVSLVLLAAQFSMQNINFYPRPVLASGYCRCLCVCVSITCLSAR